MNLEETSRARRSSDLYAERIIDILEHSFWLKKQGYRKATIQSAISALKALAKDTDLFDAESIKENIANRPARALPFMSCDRNVQRAGNYF